MGRKTQQSDQSIEHDKLGRWSKKSHFPGHGQIMVSKLKQVFIFDLRDPRHWDVLVFLVGLAKKNPFPNAYERENVFET